MSFVQVHWHVVNPLSSPSMQVDGHLREHLPSPHAHTQFHNKILQIDCQMITNALMPDLGYLIGPDIGMGGSNGLVLVGEVAPATPGRE